MCRSSMFRVSCSPVFIMMGAVQNYLSIQVFISCVQKQRNVPILKKKVKENLSDSLLVVMVLKGLPETFKSFSTVMMQQDVDTMSFSKFKTVLRNFEENAKTRSDYHNEECIVQNVTTSYTAQHN